ncbi:DUF1127 domain-containing protein [Methylobacterium gregans]|uniref:DUF1127 domain-containing protein n=1 Tax=Methylobacterium gregans TaxID=374424 RepID=UPI001EE39ED2|nr:DUF1127 domain-containing protein [Methylobacterium gregans]GLS57328.1 hypothetical protein GCM10007886_55140 [Methylobacterium gregans]
MSILAAEEDHVTAAFTVFRRWLDCRRARRELARFNDRDLADLGLVRSDVGRVPVTGGGGGG